MIEITRINVYPVNGETIKANGNIGFNDAIVTSFKIIKSKKGELFVAFPNHSYEDKDGVTQYVNDVYFVDASLRDFVTESIIKAYHDQSALSSLSMASFFSSETENFLFQPTQSL